MKDPKLLSLDSRRRVSLGALASHGSLCQHYLATLHTDGSIMLEPAVVLSLDRSRELHNAERQLRADRAHLDDEPPF